MPSVQSACRLLHSTETAMLRIVSKAYNAMNRSNVTFLALLDLSAAFDSVGHVILISRLRESFGTQGTVFN